MLLAGVAAPAAAQECPRSGPDGDVASAARTLEGRLRHHDGLRQWYELALGEPTCGERSVQLTASDAPAVDLRAVAGCRVRATGPIAYSPTGYYSLALFQEVTEIAADPTCRRRPRAADPRPARPDPAVRSYRVAMRVDYRPGDHPIVFRVSDGRRTLRPVEAYASYWLTGGLVLYGRCGEGFVVDRVYGPRVAHPSHFDEPRSEADMAAYDPESAAAAGRPITELGYTCVRAR